MKKIWQKSLASMVSAALCLTAFVGCLTVSAEKGSATITVGNVSAKPGKTVVVPVEIKANTNPEVARIDGVAVALFDLKFDTTNLTVTNVSAPDNVEYFAEPKYADGNGTIAVDPATKSIKILATSKDTTGQNYPLDFASMTVNVTFLVDKNATAKEYPITILNAQACDAGTKTETIVGTLTKYEYADNEDLIALTPVGGKVTVGPQLINFTIRTPVLQVQEKYGFRIRIDKDSLPANCDHYAILLETQKYSGSNYTLVDADPTTFLSTERDSSSTTTRDYYFYKNVAAYALNLPISLTVKFYDADNNYFGYSNTLKFDIASLAKTSLGNSATAGLLKTLYMDMLNYGTAAQVYFSQFGSNNGLATAVAINSGCDDYQQYASTTTPTLSGVKNPNDITGSGFVCTPGLQILASNNIYYRFTVPSTLDVSTLKVTLNHTNLYSREIVNSYDISSLSVDSKGRYVLPYDAVALYDSSSVVTATVTSNENPIYTFEYNINQYVTENIANATYTNLFTALSKFSVSSRAYFESLLG